MPKPAVVKHDPNCGRERDCLVGALSNLAGGLGAGGVQRGGAASTGFGAQYREAFAVVADAASVAPGGC